MGSFLGILSAYRLGQREGPPGGVEGSKAPPPTLSPPGPSREEVSGERELGWARVGRPGQGPRSQEPGRPATASLGRAGALQMPSAPVPRLERKGGVEKTRNILTGAGTGRFGRRVIRVSGKDHSGPGRWRRGLAPPSFWRGGCRTRGLEDPSPPEKPKQSPTSCPCCGPCGKFCAFLRIGRTEAGLFMYQAECRPQDSGVTFRNPWVRVTGGDSVPRLRTCLKVLMLFKCTAHFPLPKPPAFGREETRACSLFRAW